MRRPTQLLSYDGRRCQLHRCYERLMETDECVECIGVPELHAMVAQAEERSLERRIRRVLYELSDGGKTTLELVNTAGFPGAEVRRLLAWLEGRGLVGLAEERVGRHTRNLWSRLPRPSRLPLDR